MSKKKSAIIAGIAGQDGSYLAELLIGKGYRVLGFLRKDDDVSILSHLSKDIMLEETELVHKEDIVRWMWGNWSAIPRRPGKSWGGSPK